jgi:bifunctional oligoribonuclease and PAP phosphatase NrnA
MTPLSTFAREFDQKLRTLSHIALIAHKCPDGDALGSLEGMRKLLNLNHPSLQVSVVVPPEKVVDSHITWVLDETFDMVPTCDLVLVLDTSLWSRTTLGESSPQPLSILSIDHHEPQPGSIPGYLDIDSPSASIVITDIARELGWKFSPEAATALLLGIYTDTGGFIHRNSNQRAFETASFLIGQGAEQNRIAIDTFGNYTLEYLHDLGR